MVCRIPPPISQSTLSPPARRRSKFGRYKVNTILEQSHKSPSRHNSRNSPHLSTARFAELDARRRWLLGYIECPTAGAATERPGAKSQPWRRPTSLHSSSHLFGCSRTLQPASQAAPAKARCAWVESHLAPDFSDAAGFFAKNRFPLFRIPLQTVFRRRPPTSPRRRTAIELVSRSPVVAATQLDRGPSAISSDGWIGWTIIASNLTMAPSAQNRHGRQGHCGARLTAYVAVVRQRHAGSCEHSPEVGHDTGLSKGRWHDCRAPVAGAIGQTPTECSVRATMRTAYLQ